MTINRTIIPQMLKMNVFVYCCFSQKIVSLFRSDLRLTRCGKVRPAICDQYVMVETVQKKSIFKTF